MGGDHRTPNFQSAGPSSSGISRNFDLDVSPWNTGQSLRTSDDVAQLLVSSGIAALSSVLAFRFHSRLFNKLVNEILKRKHSRCN